MELIKRNAFTDTPEKEKNYLILLKLGCLKNKYVWDVGYFTSQGWHTNWRNFDVIEWYELPNRNIAKISPMDVFWEEERLRNEQKEEIE